MPAHSAGTAGASAGHGAPAAGPADLERLAAELTGRGYRARLVTTAGRLPYLSVSNPAADLLSERVYTQSGSYVWPWSQSIAPCDQVITAATIVARVLRAADGKG